MLFLSFEFHPLQSLAKAGDTVQFFWIIVCLLINAVILLLSYLVLRLYLYIPFLSLRHYFFYLNIIWKRDLNLSNTNLLRTWTFNIMMQPRFDIAIKAFTVKILSELYLKNHKVILVRDISLGDIGLVFINVWLGRCTFLCQSADIMASLCGVCVRVRVRVTNFFSKTTRPRDMLFFLKDTLTIEDDKS